MNKEKVLNDIRQKEKERQTLDPAIRCHRLLEEVKGLAVRYAEDAEFDGPTTELKQQYIGVMNALYENVLEKGFIDGKPFDMAAAQDLSELKYLPDNKPQWQQELTDRTYLAALILAKKSGLIEGNDIDVGHITWRLLTSVPRMCSPCAPDAPLYRDENFVKLMMDCNRTFGDDMNGRLSDWLISWNLEAKRMGTMVSDEIKAPLIYLQSTNYQLRDGAVAQANALLVREVEDSYNRKSKVALEPKLGKLIFGLVNIERQEEYLSMLPPAGKLEILSTYGKNGVESRDKDTLKKVESCLLDLTYQKLDRATVINLEKCRAWILSGLTPGVVKDRITAMMQEIKAAGGLNHLRAKQRKHEVLMSDPLTYIRLNTKHEHTPSETEITDRKDGEVRFHEGVIEMQERQKGYEAKRWNVEVTDRIVSGMQVEIKDPAEALIRAASIIRGLKGLDQPQMIKWLEENESKVDFVGVGELLGVNMNNPSPDSHRWQIAAVVRMLRIVEPYLNFEK
jgi:hypothetical protein